MQLLHIAKLSICDQCTRATRGSAGIDIPVAETVTILTRGICKVSLDAYGPIGQGLSAFLMGRSSSTIQGINVHLGLIDSDYVGQIQAMVSVSEHPVVIQKGICTAQLVPFLSSVSTVVDRSHGTGGFGSIGPPQNNY
uniref:dUTPase-like domain-containing protein n=1 Tax=Geospiza parvula TaxID=87175 RepID=A0A8C3MXD4_GEOPR